MTAAARLRSEDAGDGRPVVRRGGADRVTDRLIAAIEWCAAIFVGIVALDIFLSVALRKLFSVQIPDSYDLGKMLLGTLIFWGIAATSYRGTHITVDLVWSAANPRWKRAIDVFATVVLLFVVTVQTVMLFDKVRATYVDRLVTYDLNIVTWPFYAVAWVGDVCAVLLIAIRTWRLIFRPAELGDEPAAEVVGRDAVATMRAVE